MKTYPKVLLLNVSYMPIAILSWKRAVGLVLSRDKAMICASYDSHPSAVFDAAVVRLTVPTPNPYDLVRSMKYSKKNVFMRDNYSCVYCGQRGTAHDLTIDHVLPRSRGGKTCYSNCVTSCKKCNSKKDNKTPDEIGFKARAEPRAPSLSDILGVSRVPPEWKPWLPSWRE